MDTMDLEINRLDNRHLFSLVCLMIVAQQDHSSAALRIRAGEEKALWIWTKPLRPDLQWLGFPE